MEITGTGVVEVLQDGFGFLRSPDSNYLPGLTTFTFARQIRRFGLRTGDTVEGQIRGPEGRRALFRAAEGHDDQFRGPGKDQHKVHFDNLTPLYPTQLAQHGD